MLSLLSQPAPAPRAGTLLSADEARRLILQGGAPANLRVKGRLDLSNASGLTGLPPGLSADVLDLGGSSHFGVLPEGLQVRRLNAGGCPYLRKLPSGLSLYELDLRGTPIRELPSDLRVEYRIDLEACTELRSLPAGLKVGSLNLQGCTGLEALPEGLDVYFLDISGCESLSGWPERGSVRIGRLSAASCPWLTHLPDWVGDLAQLDVSGCPNLRQLPEGLRVSSWIELAGSGLRELPASLQGTRIRWRGVPVDERIAFRPETIATKEVLGERNVELRRVLLERMGYEKFLHEANARIVDRDRDPGGERRLLRVPLPDDEDLVCVAVICPSTDRQYLIRVPPTMKTCRQAVAWIAGFDNPDDYRPVAET